MTCVEPIANTNFASPADPMLQGLQANSLHHGARGICFTRPVRVNQLGEANRQRWRGTIEREREFNHTR